MTCCRHDNNELRGKPPVFHNACKSRKRCYHTAWSISGYTMGKSDFVISRGAFLNKHDTNRFKSHLYVSPPKPLLGVQDTDT